VSNSIPTQHLAIKAAVQRIEAAYDKEKEARARSVTPSDRDAVESATIQRRNAYYSLRDAVDALIKDGM